MRRQNLAVERIRLRQDALEGRVAVVIGGGRGIGREIARALAVLGARVVIADTSDEGVETEGLVSETNGTALFVRTDVSLEADVAALSRTAVEAFGTVDILINNAALCPVASVLETDVALWDGVLARNLRSAFLTCRAFLPGMLDRRQGTIVNVVLVDATPHLTACSASAHGLIGLTKALAAEVESQGVRVVAFAPGMADTVETREIAQGLAARFGFAADDLLNTSSHHAYDGLIPADHIAAALAYLVADLAGEYHGQQVTSCAVLERAGFIEPSCSSTTSRATVAGPMAERAAGRGSTVYLDVALSERLQQMIDATDAEFRRLPSYVQPIARRSFEAKTGQSFRQWRATAADLTTLLESIRASDVTVKQILRATYPCLEDWLRKLIAYYHDAPVEMASLTRDAGVLRDVAFFSPQRETSLRFLLATLERMVVPAQAISSSSSPHEGSANGDDSE